MEPTTITPEIEFLINRRKELELKKQNTWETYQALHGAIQECNNTISALTKMHLEKVKKDEVPESIPENKESAA